MRAQHELITENLAWTISRCGWRVYGRAADLRVGGTLPDMVKRAAPIAGTAKNTMHDFLFTEKLVDAIASDPRFNKGFYTSPTEVREGLLRHAKIWAVMGWMFPIVLSLRHSNQICLNDERNLLRMFDISWTQRMLFSFNPINGCISPARTDAATTSRRPDTCHLIPGAMLPNDDNRDFRNLRSVSQVTR